MRTVLAFSSPLLLMSLSLAACSGEGGDPPQDSSSSTGGAASGTGGDITAGTGGAPMGAGGTPATGGVFVTGDGGQPDTGAGGLGTGGGTLGTGGGTTGTPVETYGRGFSPTTISIEDAEEAYEDWKAIHLEDCGGGVYRVPWENAKLDATVSEGIGYGMLLTVIWNDRTAFDGLYNYYKLGLNDQTGLMHWLRYGCDAHREETYSQYPDGAAADADLDVAMALIMADCKWGDGNYSNEATTVIENIREHMFMQYGEMQVLQPGDSSWFDDMGDGCVNYSYFAPAYYREFARFDASNAQFWNDAAQDSYSLLAMASNGSTGLVRNWGSASGSDATPDCHNAYNRSASYGDDAARTPWRIATDYLWNGATEADQWTDRVTAWVNTVGIQNTVQWYLLDGNPDTEMSTWDDHTAINVGPWATGAMTYDQATVDAFAAELVAIPHGPGDHDGEYFPRMLKALSLATLAGKFTTCGG